MARSTNQKLKLLYLQRFLLERSDEEHPVTMNQMIEYLAQQDIIGTRINAAGINQGEGTPVPFSVGVDPVPRDAGCIVYNRDAPAGNFIEKGGLAHIGASDNGNKRFWHGGNGSFSMIFP